MGGTVIIGHAFRRIGAEQGGDSAEDPGRGGGWRTMALRKLVLRLPTDADGLNLMALNNISEGTRRSIVDIFSVSKISWAGRLREDDFLARLYDLTDLTKMGSTDYRIPNAKGDIVQHRVHLMLGRERYIPTRNAWISGSLNQRTIVSRDTAKDKKPYRLMRHKWA